MITDTGEKRAMATAGNSNIKGEELSGFMDGELPRERMAQVAAALEEDSRLREQYTALLSLHGELGQVAREAARFRVEINPRDLVGAPEEKPVAGLGHLVQTPVWLQVAAVFAVMVAVRFLPKLLSLSTGFVLQLVVMLPIMWVVVRLLKSPVHRPLEE